METALAPTRTSGVARPSATVTFVPSVQDPNVVGCGARGGGLVGDSGADGADATEPVVEGVPVPAEGDPPPPQA